MCLCELKLGQCPKQATLNLTTVAPLINGHLGGRGKWSLWWGRDVICMTPTLFRDVTLSLKNSLCGMLITSHNQKVSIKQKPNAWYVSRFVILSKKNMVLYTPSACQSLRFHHCLQQEANYFSKTGKIPVSFRCSNQAGKNHPNSWSICFVSRPYETSGLSARTKKCLF